MREIYVLPKFTRRDIHDKRVFIDTTSGGGLFRGLSPFVLGPCETYDPSHPAGNFENLWQFSKVYDKPGFVDGTQHPTNQWFWWRNQGWADNKAHRYPMGKGAKPLYSYWDGLKYGYIEAKKKIYARLYVENVVKTDSFKRLEKIANVSPVVLLDFDAYDHRKMGMTLKDVANSPDKKFGHAFVLAMILTGELGRCIE